MAVSPDITAGDLKSKFGKEHYLCFPTIEKIRAHALMKDQGASLSRQAQVDGLGSLDEAVGRKDVTSPSVS